MPYFYDVVISENVDPTSAPRVLANFSKVPRGQFHEDVTKSITSHPNRPILHVSEIFQTATTPPLVRTLIPSKTPEPSFYLSLSSVIRVSISLSLSLWDFLGFQPLIVYLSSIYSLLWILNWSFSAFSSGINGERASWGLRSRKQSCRCSGRERGRRRPLPWCFEAAKGFSCHNADAFVDSGASLSSSSFSILDWLLCIFLYFYFYFIDLMIWVFVILGRFMGI